jgi:protein phosphatase 1G
MGNETDNVNQAVTEKATYDKKVSNMKIGVCEMQGWRKTMEDAAIVLPNFEKNTSLFGVLDGHGGSIISEFVSVNFKNVLVKTKSYKDGKYEQALSETFLIMDELLINKKINNFIYTTHNSKENKKETKKNETIINKDSIVKLRFETGVYEFDLEQIDLTIGGEDTITTVFEYKSKNKNKEKNTEMNSTADDSKLNQSKLSKIDNELIKEEEKEEKEEKGEKEEKEEKLKKEDKEDKEDKENKNLKLDDIFYKTGGKQNVTLNGLPSFNEVFDSRKIELIFEEREPKLEITKNKSSSSSCENLIASDMGTTVNIMLIKNGIIYIANVGDSLSVMYKNKKAYNLNREHQIIIESEKTRVLKSGATIVGYRINGMLNLTRAIGDLRFKSNKNLKRHEQSVISLPEITKIEDTEGIDFIIMGCDGVWDCVKRQMVCEFVENEIKNNPEKNLSEILKIIFDRCVSRVSGVILGTDNMSCIIIQFLHNESNENNNQKIKIEKININ